METTKTRALEDVKVGDVLLIVSRNAVTIKERLNAVIKVTPKRVLCYGEYYEREDGSQVGGSRLSARIPTPEDLKRVRAAEQARKEERDAQLAARQQIESQPEWQAADFLSYLGSNGDEVLKKYGPERCIQAAKMLQG